MLFLSIVPMSQTLPSAPVLLPTDQELVLKVIPMPADCNANGDIFGGWVMAQVDLAGAVLPARLVQGRIATVAVNEFVFKQPVRVGDILSFFASVARIGRTSITVKVEVYAERMRQQGRYVKVTQANLTYVPHRRPTSLGLRSWSTITLLASLGLGVGTFVSGFPPDRCTPKLGIVTTLATPHFLGRHTKCNLFNWSSAASRKAAFMD
jgi:acyl-CoA thioesterase YciA